MKFVNIIYNDEAHTGYLTDRIEGYLLTPGEYVIDSIPVILEQVGVDRIETSSRTSNIAEYTRYFEKKRKPS